VVREKVGRTPASDVPIVHADRSGRLPLSFSQQRLWFLTQLDEQASHAYHIHGGVRLKGDLNRAALRRALDRIVWRHEALRTRFVSEQGIPVQVIDEVGCGFALMEEDLSSSSRAAIISSLADAIEGIAPQGAADGLQLARATGKQPEQALAAIAQEEASRGFSLSHGPLIRGRLLRISDAEHVLLVTMHHIVSDGWSLSVFIEELSRLYTAYSQGEADPLSPLQLQYADYAHWQRQWLSEERRQEQLQYWREQLRGAPQLLELPTDHPRPAVQQYAGASVPVVLDESLTL
jgi:hypothetical protein